MVGKFVLALSMITLAFGAPHRSKSTTQLPKSSSTIAPTPMPRLPAGIPLLPAGSILDFFLPPASKDASQSNSAQAQPSFDFPGLAPTIASDPSKRKSMAGGIDFGQLARLCETMAAANRAQKMHHAIQAAAVQPNDLFGWMELIRQAEPIPLETFACQMLERLISSPDEFVGDLLRVFMPGVGGTGDFLHQFPQFNKLAASPIPFTIQTTSAVSTYSNPTPTKSPVQSSMKTQSDQQAKKVNLTVNSNDKNSVLAKLFG